MYILPNNNENLEVVIDEMSDMVYRLAITRVKNKEMAEDVYQEVFYRYTRKRPIFENETHMKAWFIRVTINCSKTILSSKWNKTTQELDEDIPFSTPEKHDVYYAVQELKENYRTVIYLFYYEDLKISEISKILKKNENTIKTWLSRAREELKSKLEGGFDNE